MDIKAQVNRGAKPAGKWDQRKSTGQFLGAEDGFHVRTAVEFRAEGETADYWTDPDKIAEIIQPGDNALMVLNKLLGKAVEMQPAIFDPLASVFGLGGTGRVDFDFFAYDND